MKKKEYLRDTPRENQGFSDIKKHVGGDVLNLTP
jgi:hypothetical protein